MLKAVIFDLFGTLIWLPRNSRPYRELANQLPGMRLRKSLVVAAPTLADYCTVLNHTAPAGIATLQAELEADIAAAALFEDSISALKLVRNAGLKVGLISNLATPYIEAYNRLGLRQFIDVAVFSCEVGFAKPAPEIYDAALTRLDIAAEDALMVGDSQRADVDGPAPCGMQGLLLDRRGSAGVNGVIQSLNEIAQHIGT